MKRHISYGLIILIALVSMASVVFARQSDPNPNRIQAIVWNPDGTQIAVSNNSGVTKLSNTTTNQVLLTLQSDTSGPTTSINWSPNGTKLATGGADNVVRVWDVSTGQNSTSFPLTSADFISSIVWSPDGSKLAASTYNGAVKIWNTSTNQLITTLGSDQITQISWNTASNKLALSAGGVIEVWNVTNGQLEYRLAGHKAIVVGVVWRKNFTTLVSASADRTLKTWDASTGQLGMTFTGHTDAVNAVDWNPTNNQFASVSQDGSLRIWDSGNGQLLKTVTSTANPLFAVAYNPDGKKIAYGGDNGTVEIYSICPCTLFGTSVPANPSNIGNPPAVNLGVVFKPSVNGQVTGIRFYKLSGNSGTHKGYLWSSTGTQLGNVTFSGETATGWQTATFATPITVTANTVYVASYHAPQGRFAYDNNTFTTGKSVLPLYALATGETSPGNGTYIFGAAGLFPNATFNATNYWVDVVFSPT